MAMTSQDCRTGLDSAASRALEMLEDLIRAMESAADQVCSGQSLEDIVAGKHQLFLASHEGARAMVCVWDLDDYYDLLINAASKTGVRLDDSARIEVELPAMEFGEDMITGGFEAWKGLSVETRNRHLEQLVEIFCAKLKERGLALNCSFEDVVIFCLPLKGRA
jgi:hypothetical protein